MSRRSVLAAAAVAATLLQIGIAAPVVAQPAEGIAVSYADLNLANRVGREILDRRIANAAVQLCGEYRAVELAWSAASRACQAETIAATQSQRDAAIGVRGTVRISSVNGILSVSRAAN